MNRKQDFRNPLYGLNKRGVSTLKFAHRYPYNTNSNSSHLIESYDDSEQYPNPTLVFCDTQEREDINERPSKKFKHQPSMQPQASTSAYNQGPHDNYPPVRRPLAVLNNEPPQSAQIQNQQTAPSKYQRFNISNRSSTPTMRILTGGVEKTLKWMNALANHPAPILYEVLGNVRHIRTSMAAETSFAISDADESQLILVSYFNIDRPMSAINLGDVVKVIGKPRGKGKLQAFNMQVISQDELVCAQRISFVCDYAIKEMKN